ncbi:MAG: Zinc phosphodiesterase ELAC protein 2 [Piccolia ochrophora]|nr:MAG: Zinc phosphodiesterase ELAC protein 2 [Piccolia ochrophora]
MRSYVEVVTTPTADTSGTILMLHFDNKRYLIGQLAEGTQRACIERGIKLVKVSDIFLTGKTEWANNGGLIGMILTLADSKKAAAASAKENNVEGRTKRIRGERSESTSTRPPSGQASTAGVTDVQNVEEPQPLTIHGGPNLTHTLATSRRFVFRKGTPISAHEFEATSSTAQKQASRQQSRPVTDAAESEGGTTSDLRWPPSWTDENIRVWALTVEPLDDLSDTSNGSPRRSKKRSFDDIEESSDTSPAEDSGPEISFETQKERDFQLRKAVVADMFNSKWYLDSLQEMRLSEVVLPASIFIRNEHSRLIEKYMGPVPQPGTPLTDYAEEMLNTTVLVRKPWPGSLIKSLPRTTPSKTALSYIIKNHHQRGRFQPKKAQELNVENVLQFRELTNGKSVISAAGSIVTPDMVLGPGKEGGGCAVIDLPSSAYVESLLNREEWKTESIMNGVGAIFWILGDGMAGDPRIDKFMREMSHLQHVVSSRDQCPNYLAFDSSASMAISLHNVAPHLFPVPLHDNDTIPQWSPQQSKTELDCALPFERAHRGQVLDLEPKVTLKDKAGVAHLNTAKVVERIPRDVLNNATQVRKDLSSMSSQSPLAQDNDDIPSKDAEIITLGTGSSAPSKYRSVSATLLRVPGYGSYLFDCGENTLGQLRRMFTPKDLGEILRDLKLIWISHLHADHHLGTASVIKAWFHEVWGQKESKVELRKVDAIKHEPRLFIASDLDMLRWLKEYASVEAYGYKKIVPLAVTGATRYSPTRFTWGKDPMGFDTNDEALNAAFAKATGLSDLQAVGVQHCRGANACALTFPNKFKISYSGDCRPSKSFAKIGQGSTVLVHEATFDDKMHADALAKKHSTTSEALGVGVAMKARRVILTHFSQRYQKIPVLDALEGKETSLEDDEELDLDGTAAEDVPVDDPDGVPQPTADDEGTGRSKGKDTVRIDKELLKDMKIAVAFDYMRVKVGEISQLERFTPALQKLFEEQESGKS